LLAAVAAVLGSLPLAAGALVAARPFCRAAVRYRILAGAFGLVAAVGPLALLAASFRTAPAIVTGGPVSDSLLALLTLPALALALTVGGVLLAELAVDVVKLRRVKRGANSLGTLAVRRARIATSRTVSTPTAIGYVHPAVVLPEDFRTRVDGSEWDAVVAHECAHLARRDDWAKALQSAVQRVGWWLPGLWILGRALDLERELASDERAACETGPRRYAACLLRLATDRCTGALAPTFGARRSHVAIRVERLLRPVADGGPVLRAVALGAFTAAAFAVVAAAVLAVPGTGPRAVGVAPHHLHQFVFAHAALRHAAPRAVARIRRPAPHHRTTLALAGSSAPRSEGRSEQVAFVREPAAAQEPATVSARAAAVSSAAAPGPAAAARSAASAAAPRTAHAAARPPAPFRRPGEHGAPAAQPEPVETVAFATPRQRCATCFGPLHSADDPAVPQAPSRAAPGGLPSASIAAATAEDPSSGPVSLSSQMIWFRIPARAILIP
jgi:beta-lactamase regulating signal transducer with metallopeptidase domain